MSNGLAAELQAAYTYVGSLSPMQPAGITVPVRDYNEVKKLMHTNQEGIMFSGSLCQLDLQNRAISTIDFGKLGFILEDADTDSALKKLIGTIVVNLDAGNASHFVRANKDAEVDALCLTMYWSSHDSQLIEVLKKVAADLVFSGRALGDRTRVFAACLLYTSPSPRDVEESRMPSSA